MCAKLGAHEAMNFSAVTAKACWVIDDGMFDRTYGAFQTRSDSGEKKFW